MCVSNADVLNVEGGDAACAVRVLVVDDNSVIRLAMSQLLRCRGIEVDAVGSGYEAIEILHSARYDLILMDVQMPGLDGPATAREMLALRRPNSMPCVVAMTADGTEEDRERCRSAGMVGFLSKPVKIDDILPFLGVSAVHPRRPLSELPRELGGCPMALSAGSI